MVPRLGLLELLVLFSLFFIKDVSGIHCFSCNSKDEEGCRLVQIISKCAPNQQCATTSFSQNVTGTDGSTKKRMGFYKKCIPKDFYCKWMCDEDYNTCKTCCCTSTLCNREVTCPHINNSLSQMRLELSWVFVFLSWTICTSLFVT